MNPQVILDNNGKKTGVFITIEDWNLIESIYPNINDLNTELPQWQKDLVDERLQRIENNPQKLKPIEKLFETMYKDF